MGVNLSKTVEQMRRFGGDLQDIEVKEAVGGMPKSMGDSVSALANGSRHTRVVREVGLYAGSWL